MKFDPRLVGYLILYLFIIAVRYFKVVPSIRKNPQQYNYKHVFFVSLDILYTAAGLATLLVANRPDWIAPIITGYSFLLVVSVFVEASSEHFTDRWRLGAHLGLITVVVVGTVFTFQSLLGQGSGTAARDSDGRETYPFRVAVPYVDLTLDQFLGRDRLGDRRFVFTVELRANSARAAEEAARALFWRDTTVARPYDKKRAKSIYTISLVDNAIVERVD